MSTTEMEIHEEHVNAPAAGALAMVSRDASGVMALAFMSDADFESRLAAMKQGQKRVRMIQREMMEEGEDFGKIPGTDKPTLLKPGAEKLCAVYNLRARPEIKVSYGDGVTAPPVSVLVSCYMHQGNLEGPVVAVGVGAANSWERKHRYRAAGRACPSCGVVGSIRRSSFEKDGDKGYYCNQKAGGCNATFRSDDKTITEQQGGQVENPDQYDLENTLVKMSKKRALIDGTLTATATSGLFAQDLDDDPPGDDEKPKPRSQKPAAPTIITKAQASDVVKAIEASGLPKAEAQALLLKVAGVDTLTKLMTDKLPDVIKAFDSVGKPPAPDADADGAEKEPFVAGEKDVEWLK